MEKGLQGLGYTCFLNMNPINCKYNNQSVRRAFYGKYYDNCYYINIVDYPSLSAQV